MKKLVIMFIALGVGFGAVACKKKAEGGEKKAEANQAQKEEPAKDEKAEPADKDKAEKAEAADEKAKEGKKLAMVEVPDKGKEFEPAVKAAQIPEGAWMCNMGGSVHYAAMKKGEGKCPVCNMDLAEAGAKADAKMDGEHMHDHKEGEHHE